MGAQVRLKGKLICERSHWRKLTPSVASRGGRCEVHITDETHRPRNTRLARPIYSHESILTALPEVDCSPDQVHQLVSCIIQEDILYELARSIRLLPFEARKDAQIIFSHILLGYDQVKATVDHPNKGMEPLTLIPNLSRLTELRPVLFRFPAIQ